MEKQTEQKTSEKIKVTDIDIIVGCYNGRNYYEIKFKEVGKDYYDTGFGSYVLENVLREKEENFELVTEEEQKEEKQDEVTNEKLLEHLNEIEVAIGCVANGLNTLFSIISEKQDLLKLERKTLRMIKNGQLAHACCSLKMNDISGMYDKKIKEDKRNVEEFVNKFLNF